MQAIFSELEYAAKQKVTRRDRFLGQIDAITPWAALVNEIAPFYPSGEGRGRPPIGVARVYTVSSSHYWCATEWSNDNGWGSPCGTQGPVRPATTDVHSMYGSSLFSGAEHMWAFDSFYGWPQRLVQSFENSTSTFLGNPVLMDGFFIRVDAGDQLIVADEYHMRRYSAVGDLLASRERGIEIHSEYYITLLEGGMVVYPNSEGSVVCLKPDLRNCWPNMNTVGNGGTFMGILPVSSTRSVVVFGDGSNLIGTLVDSPGLNKDAPWPMHMHDLCRTNNVSVPTDNCWDGPQS